MSLTPLQVGVDQLNKSQRRKQRAIGGLSANCASYFHCEFYHFYSSLGSIAETKARPRWWSCGGGGVGRCLVASLHNVGQPFKPRSIMLLKLIFTVDIFLPGSSVLLVYYGRTSLRGFSLVCSINSGFLCQRWVHPISPLDLDTPLCTNCQGMSVHGVKSV